MRRASSIVASALAGVTGKSQGKGCATLLAALLLTLWGGQARAQLQSEVDLNVGHAPVSASNPIPLSSSQLPGALDGSGNLKTHEQGTATVQGVVTSNPGVGTFQYAAATGAAAAQAQATLPGAAGKYTYLTSAVLSCTTPAAAVSGVATINNGGGAINLAQVVETAQAGYYAAIPFPTPVQSSAQNTGIVVTVPAITSGGACTVFLSGYQL